MQIWNETIERCITSYSELVDSDKLTVDMCFLLAFCGLNALTGSNIESGNRSVI